MNKTLLNIWFQRRETHAREQYETGTTETAIYEEEKEEQEVVLDFTIGSFSNKFYLENMTVTRN